MLSQGLQEFQVFGLRPGIPTYYINVWLVEGLGQDDSATKMGTNGLRDPISPSIAWHTDRRFYLVKTLQLYTSDDRAFAQQ